MAVTISSLGAAVLAFSPEDTFAEVGFWGFCFTDACVCGHIIDGVACVRGGGMTDAQYSNQPPPSTPKCPQLYGIILLPVSLLFALYALNTYINRGSKIRTREATRWDDPIGPVLLGSVFTAALIAQFFIKVGWSVGLGFVGSCGGVVVSWGWTRLTLLCYLHTKTAGARAQAEPGSGGRGCGGGGGDVRVWGPRDE